MLADVGPGPGGAATLTCTVPSAAGLGSRRALPRRAARTAWLPVWLAGATVLLQIAYPLVSGSVRDVLTVVTVAMFLAATVSQAALTRGGSWTAGYLAITLTIGLLIESVGTATGVPFGAYDYAGSLGPKLLGVPLAIPMAWAMFAYPCLLVGQRLSRKPLVASLIGGGALASWDLFLDPQMVEAGHWRFTDVQASLPGAPGIPISNYLGWLLVAVVMVGVLQLLGRRRADDRVPAALFLWTYASSVLANAVFFGRPGVAVLGGLGMGLVVLPYVRALRRG